MSEEIDEELLRLLRDLRQVDEASAPSFALTLARAREGAARRHGFVFALIGSAVLVALVTAALVLFRRAPASPSSDSPMTITNWRPATDFLLQTSGTELLDSLPELPTSVPDYAAASGAPASEPTRPQKGARS